MVERNRALTQDLQRERAERQRVQARLLAAERGAEGLEAESLRDTVAALEVSRCTMSGLLMLVLLAVGGGGVRSVLW